MKTYLHCKEQKNTPRISGLTYSTSKINVHPCKPLVVPDRDVYYPGSFDVDGKSICVHKIRVEICNAGFVVRGKDVDPIWNLTGMQVPVNW